MFDRLTSLFSFRDGEVCLPYLRLRDAHALHAMAPLERDVSGQLISKMHTTVQGMPLAPFSFSPPYLQDSAQFDKPGPGGAARKRILKELRQYAVTDSPPTVAQVGLGEDLFHKRYLVVREWANKCVIERIARLCWLVVDCRL
jgi:hypothetical protein